MSYKYQIYDAKFELELAMLKPNQIRELFKNYQDSN